MDRLPTNTLSRIFFYLPTLDLGRAMSVCCSWNDILSTSPNLWTRIDLPLEMPYHGKAQKIITVFADRSQSKLETISYPAKLESLEAVSILKLLESSRATIKKIVLNSSSNQLMDSPDDASSPISFFRSCPVIEELYLDGETMAGTKVETSEGNLTHFSCLQLGEPLVEMSLWLSKLKFFEIRECDGPSFLTVLEKCSDYLEELRITGEFGCQTSSRMQEIISKSLGKLRILYIFQWPNPCCGGIQAHSPQLEELGTNLITHESTSVTLNNLSVLHLELPQFHDEEEEGDQRLEVLNRIVKMVESNQET